MSKLVGFSTLMALPEEQVTERIRRRILSGDQGMLVWWSIEAGVHVEPTIIQASRSFGCSRARWSSASAPSSGSVIKATSWLSREAWITRHGSEKTPK